MKKFKNIAIVIVFLSLLVTHTSCHKIDVSPFAAGDCFMTQINGKEIVIRLDNIQSDRITASYFYTNTLFADPHPCSVRLKRKGGILKTAELRRPVRINYNVENDRLIVMCKSPKLPHEIVLEECSPVDTTLFNRQLCTPLYEVKVTPDVEYARADGYWTSYPDEDKRFAEIYTQRLPDLLKMEEQSLRMDIYEPLDRPENLHPLILLIHGGAFYNGDKQDITYEKWCRHFASLGYVAVSLNYRMGFLLPYKDAIDCAGYRATQDANAALRYLMHHADFYRINPDLVFTWGSSAGAITALNVAFLRDNNRPESVTKEGRIRKLAPDCTESFRVRAVANLWGAVHDTTILANSRTAVISIHGDADGIVPYGYGIPFKKMLISSLSDGVKNTVSSVMSNGNDGNNLINNAVDMVIGWGDRIVSPAWDLVISPMYGSSCIHEYLTRHNVRSKLITVAGASQHSLHVDDHRRIVPYFYTIQDTVARFFYTEIVPQPVNLQHESPQSPYFRINNTNVSEVHWKVEGGLLMETTDSRARVVFFKGAKHHTIRVCGKYKNGVEFCETATFTVTSSICLADFAMTGEFLSYSANSCTQ